ncbi:MAG: hypothetical protein COA74_02710 [Gammaproteobacteria bacterium]|nr:MAG: hypothetical protein COA74_02710 [Gammaproteobacteria bacterium]
MNSEIWGKVKKIFSAALEMEFSRRQSFVKKSADSAEIYQTIMDMLDSEDDGDSNITKLISSNAEQLMADRFEFKKGDKIDHYELQELLGMGGMGTVFKAVRIDSDFEQEVAIKLIHIKALTSETLLRFQSERQILANLNHPNIAGLIDGGTTDANLPYLVMEFVRGKPIIEYCKINRLDFQKRIELFLQVCEAITYAHQNLIVHRDIKAENILVTNSGLIKLLDFGVAKILDPDSFSQEVAETKVETRILTLASASPEQVLGKKITTRTDVYGLGALFYQLLTEEKLFDFEKENRLKLENAICEQLPDKPSTVISNTSSLVNIENYAITDISHNNLKTIRKSLKGDLDTIVLKALQKDPDKRYQSVVELAEDIERYLNHYPIQARVDGFFYLAKKYIQRHRLRVLFTMAAVTSLVVFSIVVTVQNQAIKIQKEHAIQEAKTSEQISNFMVDIFNSSDPNENAGKNITAIELLENAKIKIEQFSNDPLLKANLMESIATVYLRLGESDESLRLLNKTLELRKSNEKSTKLEFAKTYYILGQLIFELGDYEKAKKILNKSFTLYQQSGINDEYEINNPQAVLSIIYGYEGNYEKARKIDEKTLSIVLHEFGSKSREAGDAYTNLGAILRYIGEFVESEKLIKLGLEARKQSMGAMSLETAHSLNQLTSTLVHQGKYQEALPVVLEGLRIRQFIYKNDHAEIVASLGNLSKVYSHLNKLDEAIKIKKESIVMLRRLFGNNHSYVSGSLSSLGLILLQNDDVADAKQVFLESLQISRKIFEEGGVKIAYPLTGLGQLHLKNNQIKPAITLLTEAYKIRVKGLPENHRLTAITASLLGEAYVLNGNSEAASKYLNQAFIIFKDLYGENDERVLKIMNQLETISMQNEEYK